MGHLYRCIDISKKLLQSSIQSLFIIGNDIPSKNLLENAKIPFISLEKLSYINKIDEIDELSAIFKKNQDFFSNKFRFIIIDLLNGTELPKYISFFRKISKKIIMLTDSPKKVITEADVVFAFSQAQKKEWYLNNINKKKTKFFLGLDFFPLNTNYSNQEDFVVQDQVKNILLTFGGSDPQNYSERILNFFLKNNFEQNIVLIVGPGYPEGNLRKLQLKNLPANFSIKSKVTNMKRYMEACDICLCSSGNTLVELLACGIPCLVFPQTDRELNHAKEFHNRKVITLIKRNFSDDDLRLKIDRIISDEDLRKKISVLAQKYIDGKGINRILKILLNI